MLQTVLAKKDPIEQNW